jgi:hypothetical protein
MLHFDAFFMHLFGWMTLGWVPVKLIEWSMITNWTPVWSLDHYRFPLKLDHINLWKVILWHTGRYWMHLFDSFNYGGIFYFSCAGLLYLNFAYLMVVLVETTKKMWICWCCLSNDLVIWKTSICWCCLWMILVVICLVGSLLMFCLIWWITEVSLWCQGFEWGWYGKWDIGSFLYYEIYPCNYSLNYHSKCHYSLHPKKKTWCSSS